jgi:protein TonB
MQPADQLLLGASAPSDASRSERVTPFDRVYSLGQWQGRRLVQASLAALVLHSAIAVSRLSDLRELGDFARQVRANVRERFRQELQVGLEPEPEPEPPPPPPEPEAPPEPPVAKPEPRVEKPAPRPAEPEPPAPAAAQAGRILAAEPDPDEPLDLTGTTFVQGNADHYVGGVTASKGTATKAVRSPTARPDGVTGGTGSAPASAVDHSRAAGVVAKNWNCPFPPEADRFNYQVVKVAVTVGPDGSALDVRVLSDPGTGFGREARQCALSQVSKKYYPALNREGVAIASTIQIDVSFERR